MKLTDVVVDNRTFGAVYWLVNVLPVHVYQDGKRTNDITGYKYEVALPERNLEKIAIKIDGKQLMETPDGYVEVCFNELEGFIYWVAGQYQIGARAKGISLVNKKA